MDVGANTFPLHSEQSKVQREASISETQVYPTDKYVFPIVTSIVPRAIAEPRSERIIWDGGDRSSLSVIPIFRESTTY